MRIFKTFAMLAAIAGAGGTALADFRVTIAPPAPLVETRPVAPYPGAVWTDGFWDWRPHAHRYYWTPGRWARAPYRGGYYVAPRWNRGRHGYYTRTPGGWRRY